MNKIQEMQRLIRLYKEETGVKEVDMHTMAEYALKHGWPMPKPVSVVDRLAKEFSSAAREEIRRDARTGRPYRANHAFTTWQNGKQQTLWVDIDEAPRKPMQMSLIKRREQMVGDGYQLTLDADHWNAIHPSEQPITIPMDFTEDVEERKTMEDGGEAAA